MKVFISFLASFFYIMGYGQIALKKSNISNGGGNVSVGSTHVIYSVGEVANQEKSQGTIHLSEGFIGPDVTGLLGIENYNYLGNIKVFPNPVKDLMQITLPYITHFEVHIFDLNGKKILTQNLEDSQKVSYDLSCYPTGIYLLLIIDRQNHLFARKKIQKL